MWTGNVGETAMPKVFCRLPTKSLRRCPVRHRWLFFDCQIVFPLDCNIRNVPFPLYLSSRHRVEANRWASLWMWIFPYRYSLQFLLFHNGKRCMRNLLWFFSHRIVYVNVLFQKFWNRYTTIWLQVLHSLRLSRHELFFPIHKKHRYDTLLSYREPEADDASSRARCAEDCWPDLFRHCGLRCVPDVFRDNNYNFLYMYITHGNLFLQCGCIPDRENTCRALP